MSKYRTFTCERCHRERITDAPLEDKHKEWEENVAKGLFPADAEQAIICDDCYNFLMKELINERNIVP